MDDTATPTRWRIRSLISAAASAKESRCRPWEQWENLRPVTHQRPHRRTVIARLDGQHGAGDLFSVGHLHSTAASSVDGTSGLTVSRLVIALSLAIGRFTPLKQAVRLSVYCYLSAQLGTMLRTAPARRR